MLLCALWGRAGAEDLSYPLLVVAAQADADQKQTRQAGEAAETRISANRITGLQEHEVVAEGEAVLTRGNLRVDADRMRYDETLDEVDASGNVRVTRDGDLISGPKARMQVQEQVGEFETPVYSISRQPQRRPGMTVNPAAISGHGEADKLFFEGENHYRLKWASWTTCEAARPDWYLQASDLTLDYDREVGEVRNATVWFKNVPIAYLPWADFPLAEQRQSGLLTPTFGSSNKTGIDLSLPYYWNIAPNYDATITPRLMGQRGLQLKNEVRYLTPGYNGVTRVEWLPEDNLAGRSRLGGTILHNQDFGRGLSGSVNFNGVSDPRYFTDLSSQISQTSQVNLVRQANLSYGGGDWWSVSGMLQSWQTLQDPSGSTVTVPYRRLPQITLSANRPDLPYGSAFVLGSEFVAFGHPTMDEGRRVTAYPQFSLPWQTPGFFITPKIGLHMTRYDLDRRTTTGPDTITRSVPIASVDSGLTFEREVNLGGRNLTQTLEPRLYYLYVPYRNQDAIPNFDSGVYDFNFAQIFAENAYTGGDRISNANQLTAAVSSRLIDPQNGNELMRAAFGQRYYFVDQLVTLPGVAPRIGGRADLLAAFSGRVLAKTFVDTGWQYNPRDRTTERFNAGVRYQPDVGRVLNFSWRYRHNLSTDPDNPDGFRDLDISGQWPLGGRWFAVGRYNRNLREHRISEGIAGVEYNGGCWVARGVIQDFATTATDRTKAIFVQLEFNGLAALGSSPLNLLRRSVPGYGKINDPSSPVFGDNF